MRIAMKNRQDQN